MVNLAPPHDVAEIRHIISLALYYRTFLANFSDIIRPLNELMKKNTHFYGAHYVTLVLLLLEMH